jgi:transcriptional regulator with XRE-family HTH domain
VRKATASQVAGYIAANVRRRRERVAPEPADFSAMVNITERYLRYIESGKRNLSIEVVVRLANALSCAPWELLQPAEPVLRKPGRPKRSVR